MCAQIAAAIVIVIVHVVVHCASRMARKNKTERTHNAVADTSDAFYQCEYCSQFDRMRMTSNGFFFALLNFVQLSFILVK